MNKGFTLIETLVYIALLGIIMGGALVTTYQIIYGNEDLTEKIITEEEANFILRKIEWAITEGNSTNVYISPSDTLNTPNGDFEYDGTETLTLDTIELNTINAPISNLIFSSISGSAGISVSFEMNGQGFIKNYYFKR